MESTKGMSKRMRLAGGSGLVAALAIVLAGILATANPSTTSAQLPPSRFVGSVTVNGAPAAAGTVVDARIGGKSCGTALVFLSGAEARYAIDVKGADQEAGCGTLGATVVFVVGGVQANQTGTWNNPQLQTLNLTVTTATATPTTPAATATGTAPPTSTPGAPKTGAGISDSSGSSGAWLLIALGLAAVALGTGGVVATRRAR
jgi:hypothetical protein